MQVNREFAYLFLILRGLQINMINSYEFALSQVVFLRRLSSSDSESHVLVVLS